MSKIPRVILGGLCYALLGVSSGPVHAQSIIPQAISSESSKDFEFKTVVIPAQSFEKQALVAMSEAFLRQYARKRAAVLSVYVDRDLPEQLFKGNDIYDASWNYWRNWYDELSRRRSSWQIAQAIRIGKHVALRICWADQRIEEIDLGGPSALHILVGDKKFDLLWIEPVRQYAHGDYQRLHAFLYIRATDSLTYEDALAVSRVLIPEIGSPYVNVRIRRDGWFLNDWYPTINPFYRDTEVPVAETMAHSPEFSCAPHQLHGCLGGSADEARRKR